MSSINDYRINSLNLYVETTFGEYLQYARDLVKNNDLQRKRVKISKTVYSLLKTDLLNGCVIPPLALAIAGYDDNLKDISNDGLQDYIKKNRSNVLILDGLQRTHTLIDAENEAIRQKNTDKFYNYKLRLEVYVNINKFGVLYRMLTLNTGQTPMSARHQMEMLYSDMLDTEIEGVKLVKEVDGAAFATSQAMTGYGPALGIMKDKGLIEDFNSIDKIVKDIDKNYEDNDGEWFMEFLKKNGKKINPDKTANNLYNVRCLIVHNLYSLDEYSRNLLEGLNNSFLDVIFDILFTFKGNQFRIIK